MSFFPALWGAVTSTYNPTGTVGAILSGTTNPQGNAAAPGGVGSVYINTANGSRWVKRFGGTTAFGWYLDTENQQQGAWNPRGAAGAFSVQPYGLASPSGNPNSILTGPPCNSAGAIVGANKQWAGGTGTNVMNNVFLIGPNTLTNMPVFRVGGGTVATDFPAMDCVWEIMTTPKPQPASGSTTVANIRLMAGLAYGALQASGGLGNSDTLYTEMPTALPVNFGYFGAMFRFSTAVPDPGWVMVTANDNGAAGAQTVTNMGVTCVADTVYRLRLRYQNRAGVLTLLASVNDGAEIAITGNVGPNAIPAGAGQIGFVCPYLTCRTLAAAAKSVVFSNMSLAWGAAVEP